MLSDATVTRIEPPGMVSQASRVRVPAPRWVISYSPGGWARTNSKRWSPLVLRIMPGACRSWVENVSSFASGSFRRRIVEVHRQRADHDPLARRHRRGFFGRRGVLGGLCGVGAWLQQLRGACQHPASRGANPKETRTANHSLFQVHPLANNRYVVAPTRGSKADFDEQPLLWPTCVLGGRSQPVEPVAPFSRKPCRH